MKDRINRFCSTYGLGRLTKVPQPVSGGLLHTMYRVETESGCYAVKVLNPEIMQRETALQNMINSEKTAHALAEVVPVVAAKEFSGKHVVELDDTWFMVFDWLEGASVFAPDITSKHCAKIGELLGKIHTADVEIAGVELSAEVRDVFDWEKLCKAMTFGEQGDVSGIKDFLPELLELDKEVVHALKISSSHQVISHRDLDPKNVMWQGNNPYIIDWEAAGYVNPFQELIEAMNYWTRSVDGNYDYEKVTSLTEAYRAYKEIMFVDWDTVLLRSFDGMLGWLEYNMRRAAGLPGNDDTDKEEGRNQAEGTVAELKMQRAQMNELRSWLYEHR